MPKNMIYLTTIAITLVTGILVTSCRNDQTSQHRLHDRATESGSRDESAPSGPGSWSSQAPVAKTLTTNQVIDTIVVIDSDVSTESERLHGFAQMANASLMQPDQEPVTSDYEVISDDMTFMILDNVQGVFQDSDGVTIIDTQVTNTNMLSLVEQLAGEQLNATAQLRPESIKNMVLITDGDIPEDSVNQFSQFAASAGWIDKLYIHTISWQESSQANNWCQGEAPASALMSAIDQQAVKGLHQDICQSDWHLMFQKIGQRLAYDYGLASLKLPASLDAQNRDLMLKVNGALIPNDLYEYNPQTHALDMSLVDAPPSNSTIEVGYFQ